jgi:uncharacterized HAD superfamily protein
MDKYDTSFKIGIDIDGVCRDFTSALLKTYKEYYPIHEVKPITQYELHYFFPIGKDIYNFAFETESAAKKIFLEYAPIYDGVKKDLDWLKRYNHTLIAITTQSDLTFKYTEQWIKKYKLPFDDVIQVPLFKGKHESKLNYSWDMLIDDKPETIYECANAHRLIFCMNQIYNINHNFPANVIRVDRFVQFASKVIGLSLQ